MSESHLRVRRDGPVAWLTLDRPERRNALTAATLDALGAALASAVADGARVVVLHGVGPAFSSGADLGETAALAAGEREAYLQRTLAALRTLDDLPIPTVAAVHGHALAGGCELALVCDLVVASEDACFGLPETSIGMLPVVALAAGRRRISSGTLARLALASERLDAAEAHRAGLVDVLVPAGEHLAEAGRLAGRIAAADPVAIAEATRLLRDPDPGYAAALAAAARVMGAAPPARS